MKTNNTTKINQNNRCNGLTLGSHSIEIRGKKNVIASEPVAVGVKNNGDVSFIGKSDIAFNYLPLVEGACAIRRVYSFKDNTTLVCFANGDSVVVKKNADDAESIKSAITYAILKEAFGSYKRFDKQLDEVIEKVTTQVDRNYFV